MTQEKKVKPMIEMGWNFVEKAHKKTWMKSQSDDFLKFEDHTRQLKVKLTVSEQERLTKAGWDVLMCIMMIALIWFSKVLKFWILRKMRARARYNFSLAYSTHESASLVNKTTNSLTHRHPRKLYRIERKTDSSSDNAHPTRALILSFLVIGLIRFPVTTLAGEQQKDL